MPYRQKTNDYEWRMGECLLKKVECFNSNAGKITNKIKVQVIFELKDEYEVVDLVEVADIHAARIIIGKSG